jgi:hypothetical protein
MGFDRSSFGKRNVNVAMPTIAAEAQSISRESISEWLQTRPGERCLIRVSAADTNGAYTHAIYNDIRTHRSLDKDAPISRPVHRTGSIKSFPILGGLHHHYARI